MFMFGTFYVRVRSENLNIQPLLEKVPVEETIKGIEFIKYERNIEKLKSFMDDIMPFGEKTVVKYRNKFIQRFVETEGDEIIYTPLLKFINGTDSFQTRKEVIYFIVCVTSDAVGKIVKGFYDGLIPKQIGTGELLEVFKTAMPDAEEDSIKKTYSVVTTVLEDFGILNSKKDESAEQKEMFVLNSDIRPSNEGILFSLYYEFIKLRGNKMPVGELFSNCDTFKYFLMSDLMKKVHLKWMLDLGYIEHYMMFGNSSYQFVYDSLDLLVERLVGNN
jgi:hypothetical protein